MSISNSTYNIRLIDELSQKNTSIHKINPLAKLIVSILFIVVTVSYGNYDIISMTPLVIYLVFIFSIADIPFIPIFKRSLVVLPAILCLGIFNPILDRELISFGSMNIAGGWISYLSLIIKCFLTIFSALLLMSTTSIDKLVMAMSKFHMPQIITILFSFTYRYIYVLIEEFANIWTAYLLRAPGQKGIDYRLWGPLLGQLLMRTYDKAQNIYNCMIVRGYDGEYRSGKDYKFKLRDYIYLFGWSLFLLLVKLYNIPVLIGKIIVGV